MLLACVAPLATVQAELPAGSDWLCVTERERQQQFSRPVRRETFRAGRWLLRALLREAGVNEASLGVDDQGRPIWPARTSWGLSLSHSGAWIAAALSDAGPVGLDIECPRPERDWAALSAFLGLPPDTDRPGFYRHWTLGEAWLKASPQRLNLLQVQRLRWQADPQGPAWQAQAEGVELGLVAPEPPRWCACYAGSLCDWRDQGRWRATS